MQYFFSLMIVNAKFDLRLDNFLLTVIDQVKYLLTGIQKCISLSIRNDLTS